jgi:Mg2+ and Co2+ transporter CorA
MICDQLADAPFLISSLLSRAHSNYVAQINIRMNERAEQNADVLGKLTVLGTIVLPMNIITGLWYVESFDYPKRIAKI